MNDIRPTTFDDIIGQEEVVEMLKIKVQSFKNTDNPLGHIIFLGPSGTGKTTLAHVLANELGTTLHCVSATRLNDMHKLMSILNKLKENDVVFIDEIHSLTKNIQENLYDIMEDFKVDTFVGRGRNKEPATIYLPKFTLIGATTDTGLIRGPLLRRFNFSALLKPYSKEQLKTMVNGACIRKYGVYLSDNIAEMIGEISRKNASNACRIMVNFMENKSGLIDSEYNEKEILFKTIKMQGIDPWIGLDYILRKYINILAKKDKPMGIRLIASSIGEPIETVENYIEPNILNDEFEINGQKGYLAEVESKGRKITNIGKEYINNCKELKDKYGWFGGESF